MKCTLFHSTEWNFRILKCLHVLHDSSKDFRFSIGDLFVDHYGHYFTMCDYCLSFYTAKRRDAMCNSKHKTQWPINADVDDTAKHLLSEMHLLSSLTFKSIETTKVLGKWELLPPSPECCGFLLLPSPSILDFSLSLLLFFFSEVHLHPKIDKQYKPSFIKLTFGKFLYKPPNFPVYHPRFTNFHPEENKSQHSQSED